MDTKYNRCLLRLMLPVFILFLSLSFLRADARETASSIMTRNAEGQIITANCYANAAEFHASSRDGFNSRADV